MYVEKEIFKRFNTGLNLYYTSYKTNVSYTPRGDLFTDEVNLNFQYIEVAPVMKYELTKTSFKPYAILGVQFGYLLSKEITVESTRSYRNRDYSDEKLKKLNSGYHVGLGFSSITSGLSRFNLEITYSVSQLYGDSDSIPIFSGPRSSIAEFKSVNGRLIYKIFKLQ